MPSSTIPVTISLCSICKRDDQRDEKTKKSDPCKQDVEKSENQISEGYDPQIVIPMFFHDGPPKSLFY